MPEEEAFCVLVELMESYKMREFFKPSMKELSVNLYILSELIQVLFFYVVKLEYDIVQCTSYIVYCTWYYIVYYVMYSVQCKIYIDHDILRIFLRTAPGVFLV